MALYSFWIWGRNFHRQDQQSRIHRYEMNQGQLTAVLDECLLADEKLEMDGSSLRDRSLNRTTVQM